jgi:hypothetical protein
MGYSTEYEVFEALANALTRGNPDGSGTRINIVEIGNSLADDVPEDQLQQFIRWADENIDADLGGLYQTPFSRVNRGTYMLAADVTALDTFIQVVDNTRFNPGDVILLRDDINSQELTILDIPTETRIDLTAPVTNSYVIGTARVERIKYPDPIPKISARLAAAAIYDKHFAAQAEGNESETGKYLRKLAYQDVNAILSGTIRLYVADANSLIGRRFYNPALDDAISTKAKPGDAWFKGE